MFLKLNYMILSISCLIIKNNIIFFNLNYYYKLCIFLLECFPLYINSFLLKKTNNLHIYLTNKYNRKYLKKNINFFNLFFFFKYSKNFKFFQLLDIVCIDLSEINSICKFELIYVFLNVFDNKKIYFRFFCNILTNVNSLYKLFKSSNWLEREVYELFGIIFKGHPDLRHLLLDYGFKGYPGRKEFPKLGFIELRYSQILGSVIFEPIECVQEYRYFKFKNPWINV